MSKALNKVRYQTFLKQARGNHIQEVHIDRLEKGKHVVLQYTAKPPKGRGKLTGEWSIEKGEDGAAVDAEVREVLGTLRKHFLVRRGEGLSGEAFADAAQEVPAVEPIKGEPKE